MEYALEDPNVVYEFDENGNPRIPEDSQSLIQPEAPVETPPAIPLITNRPERRQEAIDTRGGYIDENQRSISYKDSPEGRDISPPAISLASPVGTNQEEYRQAALDSGGAFVEKDGTTTNYGWNKKAPPQPKQPPPVEQMIKSLENVTYEQRRELAGKMFKVDLNTSAEEIALQQVRSEEAGAFKKRFGYSIQSANNADLGAFLKDRDKVQKDYAKIISERQRLAQDWLKDNTAEAHKALAEELRQLKELAPKTPKIDRVDLGDRVEIYENGVKVRTETKGQAPGTVKPEKPEKGPASIDLKRLGDMIDTATEGGKKDPSTNNRVLIEQAAAKAGYNFVNTKGLKPGILWGTNPTNTWDLVPKTAAATTAPAGVKTGTKKLIGKKNGKNVYDIGNGEWQVGE